MKRLFILVAAIIALGSTSFAGNNEYELFSKLNEKEKFEGLSNYLQVNFEQQSYLKDIFALSIKKLEKAMSNGAVTDKESRKILAFNLANAKDVLSSEQYRKYLIILNTTINNNKYNSLVEM